MSSNVTSVTSHFATANEGFSTTTSGQVLASAATVGLNSVAGLVDGSVFVGVIEPGGTKEQVFTGTVDTGGSQISGVIWTKGTNVTHSSGVSIVDYDTGTAFNMMRKGILVSLDQDGTLKAGAVDSATVLASNVVITAKINDDAVTDAKLIYGKLRTRVGGSATNWSTAGTTVYDYSATNVFEQTGTSSGNAGADVTITFGVAFNQVPNIIATVSTANTANCFVVISARTATQFAFRCIDSNGAQCSEEITWIAVGE
jgi:hypothetical protein